MANQDDDQLFPASRAKHLSQTRDSHGSKRDE